MHKQCVPGALSPPPPRLGTRLGGEGKGEGGGKRVGKGRGVVCVMRYSEKGRWGGKEEKGRERGGG